MKKIIKKINEKAISARCRLTSLLNDRKGDLATNTIGAIIIAVVIVGLLIVAIKAFFPDFFTGMFTAMKEKLNANW
jgi:beta-lactamase regulating signal transducer with metallopeptidase domain